MENKDKKHRLFGLSTFAVDNATSIFLITLMIVLFGLRSYDNMPKEMFPDASLPTVFINTPYFGNSAEEIENFIARPIEDELEALTGIKNVTSTSIQDFSVIVAEFESDVDIDKAVRKVKDAVDKARTNLPDDLKSDPEVLEIKFSDLPIVTVNVAGDFAPDQLRKYAEEIQDEIERVKEINRVNLKGALEREVKINVDLYKMQALKVSFRDLEGAIGLENITMSAGEIVDAGYRRSLRVIGQFETIDDIRNIIIKSERQRPIVLKDIADVEYAFHERTSYARSDGYPVISLDVIKRKGQNMLSAIDNIKERLEILKKSLPGNLEITLFNDRSVRTRNQVSNLENSIISGMILVILVLLFFLGLRNASFVGIAIPLSMLMGIMILDMTGNTLNIVVLFSLILALGMLVDNAIVVVENIYRYMQLGYDRVKAAKYGAGEVAMPIIASTATTLAAFLPLAVWPGIMGKFMKFLPITLIIVLTSSLFVALVINPVFTRHFMIVQREQISDQEFKRRMRNVLIGALVMMGTGILAHFFRIYWLRNIMGFAIIISWVNFFIFRPGANYFQNKVLPKLEHFYDIFIRFSLKGWRPLVIFLGMFVLLGGSVGLLRLTKPRIIFFPKTDPMYINTFVELPMGTDIKETNRVVKEIEDKIRGVLKGKTQIVEAMLTQIGENTADPNSPPEPGVTPNKARITVSFVETQYRDGISTRTIMNDIRDTLADIPGILINVDQNKNGPPTGKPINLEIKSKDLDLLIQESERIKNYINGLAVPGIEELKIDVRLGKPELLIKIDRQAARRYQISTMDIASALRTSVFGKEVSKFKVGEDDYPIVVRLSEQYRKDINSLMNQPITFRNPANGRLVQVPIAAVATYEYSSTYSSIRRLDGERVVTIYSNVIDGYTPNDIVQELKERLEEYDWKPGFSYSFTGEQKEQAENMAFLKGAFLFALFLIFIIIVAQFNSIVSPFIILISIVFSTIGVFLGYAFTGMDITVIFVGVGIISLAGIVVNNAIVLIDYTNLLVKQKRESLGLESMTMMDEKDIQEAIVKGGATRLRPVLLTAITTVLGLIPLAYGVNFDFFTLISDLDPNYFSGGDNTAMWGPMAWTIIFGLTFATFLTLIVVPVMYWLAYKMKRK